MSLYNSSFTKQIQQEAQGNYNLNPNNPVQIESLNNQSYELNNSQQQIFSSKNLITNSVSNVLLSQSVYGYKNSNITFNYGLLYTLTYSMFQNAMPEIVGYITYWNNNVSKTVSVTFKPNLILEINSPNNTCLYLPTNTLITNNGSVNISYIW